MRKLLLLLCVCVCGCAAKTPPRSPQATFEDCQAVYTRMLSLVMIQVVDPNDKMTDGDRRTALEYLDQHYQQAGTTGRFYSYCSSHINKDQVDCMKQAVDAKGMDLCNQLLANPK
jgi:hypothetical protein